jgi:hypothetical protein
VARVSKNKPVITENQVLGIIATLKIIDSGNKDNYAGEGTQGEGRRSKARKKATLKGCLQKERRENGPGSAGAP